MGKGQIISIMVMLVGLFLVAGLILTIPNGIGVQNKTIMFSLGIILLGLFGIIKLFK